MLLFTGELKCYNLCSKHLPLLATINIQFLRYRKPLQ